MFDPEQGRGNALGSVVKSPIYLDHNASAPLDPEVLEAMRPHWLASGNPESRHQFGRGPRRALDQARETVARILNADPAEVLFTSGGTESNNLGLLGLAGDQPGPLVTTPIEHPAVTEPLNALVKRGWSLKQLPVGGDGRVILEAIEPSVGPETRLGSMILAQNETGVLQPVNRLVEAGSRFGIPIHTDAVQAVGRIPVDFRALGVTTLAASAHKFHGPVGVGLLLIRSEARERFQPRLFGGGQQQGRRPGTPAVALAVGLGAALHRWNRAYEERQKQWVQLCDLLESMLREGLGRDGVRRTGPDDPNLRLPQTLHLSFPGINGDALLMQLDLAGVACSIGSACASGSTTPSPTLLAMGFDDDLARSSIRFSFGAESTVAEVTEAGLRVIEAVRQVRNSNLTAVG